MASPRKSAKSSPALACASSPIIIGRPELLKQRQVPNHPKANTLDLSRLLVSTADNEDAPRYCTRSRNDAPHERPLDDIILQDAKDAITEQRPISLSYKVTNVNRSLGTKVSGEIGYQYGEVGLPEGTLGLKLTGSAGQSFGAFLAPGLRMVPRRRGPTITWVRA